MGNQIGEHYVCSDASCGCEVEILKPCPMVGEERRVETGRRVAISSELSTPPSAVNEPRINPGLQEGAGERGVYGSPKFEEGGRGPFRSEEVEETAELPGRASSRTRITAGDLTCFCGSPMILLSSRSTSARAGKR